MKRRCNGCIATFLITSLQLIAGSGALAQADDEKYAIEGVHFDMDTIAAVENGTWVAFTTSSGPKSAQTAAKWCMASPPPATLALRLLCRKRDARTEHPVLIKAGTPDSH